MVRKAPCRKKVFEGQLFLSYVTASVPHFVAFKVRAIDALGRLGFLAACGQCALIAVFRMELIIYVALEVAGAVKPRAGADEDVPAKPFRTVISRGSTIIRGDVIVTIRTIRGYSDVNADLSIRFGGGNREAETSYSS
jgi:hypothetical protein